MRALISQKALSESLGLLEKVIPSRSSNPALTSLKLRSEPGRLRLYGSNQEVDLATSLPADVREQASLVVPAQLFSQVVKSLGGEQITLSTDGHEVRVESQGSEFKLQAGDLEAFPELDFERGAALTLDAAALARGFARVRYAAATEAFQAVFRGVKLELRPGQMRVVASDGFRLAISEFAVESDLQRDLIVPARSVDEVARGLKDGGLDLSFGDGVLTLSGERMQANLRLLDGDFPDYERVIPRDIKLSITVEAERLREAVGRVAVLADKNANNRIEFNIDGDELHLSAEGEYGKAHDTLSVSGGGGSMSVGFNAKYVTDALGVVAGPVTLEFNSPTSPVLFRASEDSGYLAVVVPLRV